MGVEIRLPQLGMAMQEGTLVTWHKAPGDPVEAGEVIAEIEAEKVTEELVSPVAGVVSQLRVAEGQVVAVLTVLAVIATADEPSATQGGGPSAGSDAPSWGDRSAPAITPPSAGAGRIVTPRARRLAGELGVDLTSVTGSGPEGRITEDDVTAAAATRPAQIVPNPSAVTIPLSGMRGAIASRMLSSIQTTAQLTLSRTIDVTDLLAFAPGEPDPIMLFTPTMVVAAATALRTHPRLNATIRGDQIHLLEDVNVGVAVALADGLVVPVIRRADAKSVTEVAAEIAELARRARAGELRTADITGGTFTVTALGALGIDVFTPILNPPEAAILGVGRVIDQPTRSGDALLWRKAVTVSLTIDHRVVDGAPAAQFLATLATLLQR